MEKIKYFISLDIKGTVPFPMEEGLLEDITLFKKTLKKYIETTLGCQCKVKKCKLDWKEEENGKDKNFSNSND